MSTGLAHRNTAKGLKFVENFAQITQPAPAQASVFLEEDPYSIQNGAIGIEPAHTRATIHWNLPASRHDNSGVLTFADGHGELWKWRDDWIPHGSKMLAARFEANPSGTDVTVRSSPRDRDLKRLQATVPF